MRPLQEADPRLILVSNRLPVSIRLHDGHLEITPSSGGVATGLRGPHDKGKGLWVGWPGEPLGLSATERDAVDVRLREARAIPVRLPPHATRRYYEGFCNGVLWPLLHCLVDRIPTHSRDWEAYVDANERFADAVAEHAADDDVIWVHDYHLLLLPSLLRRRLPRAKIGFFLHVPFPAPEVFRALPWREQVLEGLLGADLVGFHTFGYLRDFSTSLLRILGIEPELDRVLHGGRTVKLGVFPMGIDSRAIADMASDPDVLAEAEAIRRAAGTVKLMLGVDRLDYTKGIKRRLTAVARLLEREPSWRGRIRFIQVAVPSRENVVEYRKFRGEIEGLVGRINGAHGTVHGAPIHYLYRSVSQRSLVALYRAADVMAVTPLRDGMNLVCKEFVAARTDRDGVLVLSELAGAASELGEAIRVNPYDVDGMASAFARALDMPADERSRRMTAMHARVVGRTVHDWVDTFRAELATAGSSSTPCDVRGNDAVRELASHMAAARRVVLLLDYDGTLVPFADRPDEAAPGGSLLDLLGELCRLPGVELHIVSGRSRASLEAWLGGLPLGLHAEHGVWSRPRASDAWRCNLEVQTAWKARVRPILDEYSARTPGALVEDKTAGIAWHYRAADPELGLLQAQELRMHLVQMLAQLPLEILPGDKVLEIRPHGARKALVSSSLSRAAGPATRFVAFGDDRTDEDLFAGLPDAATTVHVGDRPTNATHRVSGPADVRAVLARFLAARMSAGMD